MQQSLPRLFASPILFAHRGASLVEPENSLAAFSEALRIGASGLETDVWISRDGVLILDHDGLVRVGLRRRPIATLASDQLPSSFSTLAEMLELVSTVVDISVDVKDVNAFGAMVDLVEKVGRNAESLWICHPELKQLIHWRNLHTGLNYVHSTKLRAIEDFPEKHARLLRDERIRVCNMHWRDWSGGLVAMYHRFDIACFAWGLTHRTEIREMLRIGIDGLYADDIELLVSVAR